MRDPIDPTFGPNRSADLSSGSNVCVLLYEMPLGEMPLDGMPLRGAATVGAARGRRARGAVARVGTRAGESFWERVNVCFLCDIQVTE
jgi:hypothetical protein